MRSYKIVCLPGDGIGPEVTDEARRCVDAIGTLQGFSVEWQDLPVGGASIDAFGVPLKDTVVQTCLASDAVLLGAVGGPKWDDLPVDKRPEAGLLGLRKALGVFANLRPVTVLPALADASPLKAERVAGTDLLVVRELTGGIYFGTPSGRTGDAAVSTMRYSTGEIKRVAHVAFEQARRRRGKVTSVDKSNVLAVSQLWRETVIDIHRSTYKDVELEHMYVDNAAMQLVLRPAQFDVILTGNLFGDILSDASATLVGSLGLLASASIGGRVGLFEPVHGTAPDIAGRGIANPFAAILSASMMLGELGEQDASHAVKRAVGQVLENGNMPADLVSRREDAVSTRRLGDLVILAARESLRQPEQN